MSTMMGSLPKPAPFFIEHGGHFLHGDLLPKDIELLPEILFINGVSGKGRAEFLLLRQILWELYSLPSCAFDFIGQGRLTLAERVAQAGDVIHACFDLQSFSVVAVSSSDIADSLAAAFPIRHWVALNPVTDGNPLGNMRWQPIKMPVETEKTLAYLNNNTALLASIAAKINAVLGVRLRAN